MARLVATDVVPAPPFGLNTAYSWPGSRLVAVHPSRRAARSSAAFAASSPRGLGRYSTIPAGIASSSSCDDSAGPVAMMRRCGPPSMRKRASPIAVGTSASKSRNTSWGSTCRSCVICSSLISPNGTAISTENSSPRPSRASKRRNDSRTAASVEIKALRTYPSPVRAWFLLDEFQSLDERTRHRPLVGAGDVIQKPADHGILLCLLRLDEHEREVVELDRRHPRPGDLPRREQRELDDARAVHPAAAEGGVFHALRGRVPDGVGIVLDQLVHALGRGPDHVARLDGIWLPQLNGRVVTAADVVTVRRGAPAGAPFTGHFAWIGRDLPRIENARVCDVRRIRILRLDVDLASEIVGGAGRARIAEPAPVPGGRRPVGAVEGLVAIPGIVAERPLLPIVHHAVTVLVAVRVGPHVGECERLEALGRPSLDCLRSRERGDRHRANAQHTREIRPNGVAMHVHADLA